MLIEDLGMMEFQGGRRHLGKFKCDNCGTISIKRFDYALKIEFCRNCHLSDKKLYHVWEGMVQRCYNKNSKLFKWYGSRGILICDAWRQDPREFIKWAEQAGYAEGMTIDRINNLKGYCPDNCQWLSRVDNLNKDRDKRKSTSKVTQELYNQILVLKQENKSFTEIAYIVGLSRRYVSQLVYKQFIPKTIVKSEMTTYKRKDN